MMLIRAAQVSLWLNTIDNTNYHIVMEVKSDRCAVWLDGVLLTEVLGVIPTPFTESFTLGGLRLGSGIPLDVYKNNSPISLFRTYDTPVDVAVLYADAQLKGLL
ncbi:MAG: hypothetical protein L3I99_02005 [Sulfurimonas sp.]|nr:hypothetical protein [Sulfurimonas sp.]